MNKDHYEPRFYSSQELEDIIDYRTGRAFGMGVIMGAMVMVSLLLLGVLAAWLAR